MPKKLTHEEFIEKLKEKSLYYRQNRYDVVGKYNDAHTPIECYCNVHKVTFYPCSNDLYNGSGCRQCGRENTSKQFRMAHEEFMNKLAATKRNICALDQYLGCDTKIKFKCSEGHIWEATPYCVLNLGRGCPYCAGTKVLSGFNDLWTTRPDIAKMLKNCDDGYKYSRGMNKKVDFICPSCGSILNKQILSVCRRGLSCSKCGDGISYPNKFGRAFLDQLPIDDYCCEYRPDWAKPYFYDNYFEYNNKKTT